MYDYAVAVAVAEAVAVSIVESISVANSNPPARISNYRTGHALQESSYAHPPRAGPGPPPADT